MIKINDGKEKCELLKTIRTYVAEKYGLDYTPTECTHKGHCLGTCPKCDEELENLHKQLEEKGITNIREDKHLSEMVDNYLEILENEEKFRIDVDGQIICPKEHFSEKNFSKGEKENNIEDDISDFPSPNGSFLQGDIPEDAYKRRIRSGVEDDFPVTYVHLQGSIPITNGEDDKE